MITAQLDGTAAPGSYDTVVLLNVLEHIPDDHQALGDIYESLAPGGKMVLWVPAFEALYSKFDQRIGHYRRYRENELLALVHKVGFQQVTGQVHQHARLLRVVADRPRPQAVTDLWHGMASDQRPLLHSGHHAASSVSCGHRSVSRCWSSHSGRR